MAADDSEQRITIDQAVQLLELTRWHPDRAAPAQRMVHERQMRALARDAAAKSDAALAVRRLICARNGDPDNPEILELLAHRFREAGQLKEAGRAARDWIRADPGNRDAHLPAEAI